MHSVVLSLSGKCPIAIKYPLLFIHDPHTPTVAEYPVSGGILNVMPDIKIINQATDVSDITFLEVKTMQSVAS